MMALVCTNAAIFGGVNVRHDHLATAERSDDGGWRARCPCGSTWRLTPAQVEALALDGEQGEVRS
jgi:hypothetical protein